MMASFVLDSFRLISYSVEEEARCSLDDSAEIGEYLIQSR